MKRNVTRSRFLLFTNYMLLPFQKLHFCVRFTTHLGEIKPTSHNNQGSINILCASRRGRAYV